MSKKRLDSKKHHEMDSMMDQRMESKSAKGRNNKKLKRVSLKNIDLENLDSWDDLY